MARPARSSLLQRARVPAAIVSVSAVLTALLRLFGALEGTENALYDLRAKGHPAKEVSERIVAVPIDNASTERVGRWPWPRPITAEIARDLDRDGARVILLDVSFKDASFKDALRPDDDERFVQVISSAGAAITAYSGDVRADPDEDIAESQRRAHEYFVPRVPIDLPGAARAFPHAPVLERLNLPIPEFVAALPGVGRDGGPRIAVATTTKDSDGKIRRMPLLFHWVPTDRARAIADPGERKWLPSLVLASLCRWYDVDPSAMRAEPGRLVLPGAREPGETATRDVVIPVDSGANLLVHYARSAALASRFHSAFRARAADVQDPRARPQVKDRIAVVYTSFSSSGDLHVTPLTKEIPGGLINAEAINTVLTEDWVRVAPWWLLPLLLLVEGALLVAFSVRWTSYRLVGASLLLVFFLFVGGFSAFNAATLFVELAAPAVMAVLGGAGVVVYKTWVEDRERVDLLFTMRALQNQAMKDRAAGAANPATLGGGSTAGSTSATDVMKRSADYGKFIESLRDIESLENTYIGKNYRMLHLIDEGGMGIVFKAYDEALDRTVAVKVLTRFSAKLLKRFQNEAKAVGRLQHPNVVQVYEMASEGDIPYIVMEYVHGTSLSQRIRDDGPLPVVPALEVLLQVARGLDAAHVRQIIHRDIKTSNILLAPDGTAKIIDFGIAKIFRTGHDEMGDGLTGEKEIVGTADYMSPEQGQGRAVDSRSDIYSLGITLYRVLSGRLPFRAEDTVAVLLKQIKDPLPDIRNTVPDVPSEIVRIMNKMVEKRPEDRYQSCQELCIDLEAFLHRERSQEVRRSP
jgi:CHASE2 domain-containing sensor protein/tRNA A-37 threonylcarbamoyl transferase component Bud32